MEEKKRNVPEGQTGKARIVFVDYMKAFLIVTVVLCHINALDPAVNAWLRSFNMPAFFFAGGFLLKDVGSPRELADAVGRKFRSLMIPYYLWAVI